VARGKAHGMAFRIVLTSLWVIAGLVSALFAVTSVFMFDAPGAASNPITIALFFAVILLPILWFVGAALPWAFQRRPFGKWLFLLPLVDLAAIGSLIAALEGFCGGQFACGK
jgi:ABC-type sulfate transport system permease subunit